MGLVLSVSNKKTSGVLYKLKDGLTIGRSGTDILVEDPKVSSTHAKVQEDALGRLTLLDQGSSNGILFEGERVRILELIPGKKFRLGETSFVVEDDFGGVEPWRAIVGTALEKLTPRFSSLQKPISHLPFPQPVKLKIIHGPQEGNSWILGYGPRTIGNTSVDLPIAEFGLDEACFTLLPENNSVMFQTSTPSLVLFNGSHTTADKVRSGDVVQIGGTKIQIEFMK